MKRKNLSYIIIAVILVILILALPRLLGEDNSAAPQAEPAATAETAEAPDTGYHDWANPQTLPDHFERHGGDFGAADMYDYARMAHELYENRNDFQVKADKNNIRVYDPAANAFGAYHKDGTTKTFFKPDDGQAYFDRQPGD